MLNPITGLHEPLEPAGNAWDDESYAAKAWSKHPDFKPSDKKAIDEKPSDSDSSSSSDSSSEHSEGSGSEPESQSD